MFPVSGFFFSRDVEVVLVRFSSDRNQYKMVTRTCTFVVIRDPFREPDSY